VHSARSACKEMNRNGGAQGAGLTVACGGGGVVVAVDGCGSRQ